MNVFLKLIFLYLELVCYLVIHLISVICKNMSLAAGTASRFVAGLISPRLNSHF